MKKLRHRRPAEQRVEQNDIKSNAESTCGVELSPLTTKEEEEEEEEGENAIFGTSRFRM